MRDGGAIEIPPQPRSVTLTVLITAAQFEVIKQLELESGRSRSDIVRRILDRGLGREQAA